MGRISPGAADGRSLSEATTLVQSPPGKRQNVKKYIQLIKESRFLPG